MPRCGPGLDRTSPHRSDPRRAGAPARKDHRELVMSRSRKSRSCSSTRPRRKGLLIVRDELAGRIAGMNAHNAGAASSGLVNKIFSWFTAAGSGHAGPGHTFHVTGAAGATG
jgi:hypothetical protein